MNYLIYVTIFSLAVFSLPNYSHGQQKFPYNYKLIRTCDISKNLNVVQPNANGEWPAKVLTKDFKVSKFEEKIRLNIIWTADTKNVKGFRLVLTSSQKSWCYVFDYTDVITYSIPGNYSFGYNFKSIHKQKVFKAELHPLPVPSPNFGNFSVWDQFNSLDCSYYDTTISYDYDGRHMNVTFTKESNWCHYKAFEVKLYHNTSVVESNIVPTQENVDKLQTYFELTICRGIYFILVTVYDENWSDSETCVCKDFDGLCRGCSHKKSEEKYFVPDKSCSPKTTLPSKEPEEDNIFFPLTIVMGLLLLTALALGITHWKLSVNLMVKKRGIVLFLDDHEPHTNAVTKLINYLNESHLKVLLASNFLKNHDIPDQLVLMAEFLKSDFVLLVLSSALQKRMAAWDKHQDYVDFFKEKNSNILTKTLLEMPLISNKLYVCKFDHVAEFGNWPKPCYSLPSNLTSMVADLNGQSYSQRLVLCNCLKSNALRNEFRTAFKKAFTYEQSHANWFQEKYVCPTNVAVHNFIADETSQDSFSQSAYPNGLKLKELFIDYKNNNPDLSEEGIIDPSVFSEKLEAVNNRNL